MRPVDLCHFLLTKKQTNFLQPCMMVKPSSSSSSSKQAQVSRVGVSMEIDKVKQEPRLSGAYIRSLVKHLSTSIKSKDSFHGDDENIPESVISNGGICFNDHNNIHQEPPPPPPPPPPPHKKQVRRRQQTSKPYHERLLNMAEARREIVTALKFHRASMKQRQTTAADSHRLPDQSPTPYPSSLSLVPHYWPISKTTPPPLPPYTYQNLDFTLPNQTLGLNLNFQDFKNLDANLYLNYSTSSSASASSSSSPSTSSSAVISLATEEMTAVVEEMMPTTTSSSSMNGGLHHAMDEEEIEEIRSLGEQHQMEWNDTMNSLMSARWLKFLKTFEIEQNDGKLDQVIEFPACMDIDEIEGMDEEWLA